MRKNLNFGYGTAISMIGAFVFTLQVSALVFAVNADTLNPVPILKTGLWEITISNPLDPNKGSFKKRCAGSLSQETDYENEVFTEGRQKCKILSVTRGKEIVRYTATCDDPGGLSRSIKGEFAGDFASEFTQKDVITPKVTSQLGELLYTKRFRFVGQCPADMKPGDSMISHDRKKTFNKYNAYEAYERAKLTKDAKPIDSKKP